MLSFDITDRNIRIIKGTESNGKIKISSAATLSLEEAVIVNGHVNDINRVAMMINQILKQNSMADKEAIVSISTNQTVFKELLVAPAAKEQDFLRNVRHELQTQINVDDSFAVSYIITGEPEEGENGEKVQRVLATACPNEVVDCYRRIFGMLNISLRSMMIGCNCITKVLLADAKIKAKMPLLAVQIDNNFISLNLYEDNQLSFSRFASIDPEDYDNPDDYVFEAVTENIFRMLQFARSRGSAEIENVIFYGDTEEIPRLIDEMEKADITVSQLNVPPQIHGYQNLEFSVYANAIGAMFKRNKLVEHINLIETEAAIGNTGAKQSSGNGVVVGGLLAALLIVGGVYVGMSIKDKSIVSETNELQDKIDSPETAASLQHYEDLLEMRDAVKQYQSDVTSACMAYNSQPVITSTVYDAIDDALLTVMENTDSTSEEAEVSSIAISGGTVTVPIVISTETANTQEYPAALVEYLYDNYGKVFSNVAYTGYTVVSNTVTSEDGATEETTYTISFSLTLDMCWNEAIDVTNTSTDEEESADDTASE